MAVRRGPFVPDPRPDPREMMAALERRVRELAAEAPGSNGPMSLRGENLQRVLEGHIDTPMPKPPSSGVRYRH
jgi:hypothetical protein